MFLEIQERKKYKKVRVYVSVCDCVCVFGYVTLLV